MSAFEQQPIDNPGGGRTLLEWNSELWMDGCDRKRPLRVEVLWKLPNSTTGLPEGADVKRVEDATGRLEGIVKRRAGGRYALRVTGDGQQEHVFYIPAKTGLVLKKDPRAGIEQAARKLGDSTGYPVEEVRFVEDPEWTRLLGIYERHDPEQWHSDRALMIHMIKQRDAVLARRAVHHKAVFPDRDSCRTFLQAARKERFKSEGGPKETDDGWIGRVVRKEAGVATWVIHPVVLVLKRLAEDAGGEYDGWSAEVIKRKDPEPLTAPKVG